MNENFDVTYKALFRKYYPSLIFYATRLIGEEEAMEEINQRRAEFYQPDNNEVIRRIEDRELRKEIYNAINELPDKCKEVFKLSYLHEMKNKEIADVLGISLRTVEAHMYKALKYLRSRLDPLWIILFLFL